MSTGLCSKFNISYSGTENYIFFFMNLPPFDKILNLPWHDCVCYHDWQRAMINFKYILIGCSIKKRPMKYEKQDETASSYCEICH